jgi:hypothetical protein
MNYLLVGLVVIIIAVILFFIYRQIEEFELQDDPMIIKIKEKLTPFLESYSYRGKKGTDIMKKIKIYKGGKSYTINKERIYLCLRDEKNNYYNINMLMYVVLHELAHVFSESVGHTEEFNIIFQDILEKANQKGIYNPSIPIEEDYCKHGKDE